MQVCVISPVFFNILCAIKYTDDRGKIYFKKNGILNLGQSVAIFGVFVESSVHTLHPCSETETLQES